MKIRYVIIEDEPLAAERLENNIQKMRGDWQCLGVIQSVREAKKRLPALEPQLIFLDVHLADDISFAIFTEIEVNTPIIFTTAYDQYALKAFQLNSVDYLLKPINNEELTRALLKFEAHKIALPNVNKIAQSYTPEYRTRFLVSTGTRIKTLSEEDVAYFFANGKHSYLIDTKGTEHLFDQPLSKLIEQLNPKIFYQINRQYILSLSCIVEMIAYSKGRLKVITNPATADDAIVSVDKSGGFKTWVGG